MSKETISQQMRTGVEYLRQGFYDRGLKLLVEAKSHAQQAQGADDLVDLVNVNIVFAYHNRANALHEEGLFAEALQEYGKAFDAYQGFQESFSRAGHSKQHQEQVSGVVKEEEKIRGYSAEQKVGILINSGNKWHEKGNKLTKTGETTKNWQLIVDGIRAWQETVDRYERAAELMLDSKAREAKQKIVEICNAAISWANLIGQPSIAEFYLNKKKKAEAAEEK